jgi:2-dehydropantoate 2-reductase
VRLAKSSAALSLQNSVTKDSRLAEWIGHAGVIGAATTESATLIAPGHVRHTGTAPVAFYFGELDGRRSNRVADLVTAFQAAGFGCAATESIAAVEWEKLLQAALIAAFSITAIGFLPDRTITDALQTRPGAEYYVQLARELLAVYHALGFTPGDYFAPYAQFRRLAAEDAGGQGPAVHARRPATTPNLRGGGVDRRVRPCRRTIGRRGVRAAGRLPHRP